MTDTAVCQISFKTPLKMDRCWVRQVSWPRAGSGKVSSPRKDQLLCSSSQKAHEVLVTSSSSSTNSIGRRSWPISTTFPSSFRRVMLKVCVFTTDVVSPSSRLSTNLLAFCSEISVTLINSIREAFPGGSPACAGRQSAACAKTAAGTRTLVVSPDVISMTPSRLTAWGATAVTLTVPFSVCLVTLARIPPVSTGSAAPSVKRA